MVKNIKMGKVSLPMDVSSSDAIPAFETMLSKGPMAVVLVYADWCGHCDKYKKNVWSPLKSVKNRTVNLASVREDMLPNTSLKNSKIDGYPSILVVGEDKQPAVFNNNSGETNALPESNDVSTMKSLITAPIPTTARSVNNTRVNNTGVNISYPSLMASTQAQNVNMAPSYAPVIENNSSMSAVNNSNELKAVNNSNELKNENTLIFAENTLPTLRNVSPPMIESDEVPEVVSAPRTSTANTQGTTPLRGGRLARKLSMKLKYKSHRKSKRSSKRKN